MFEVNRVDLSKKEYFKAHIPETEELNDEDVTELKIVIGIASGLGTGAYCLR